jgi:hypothetical protein
MIIWFAVSRCGRIISSFRSPLAKRITGIVVACGELGDHLAEPQSDLLQDRRGRDRGTQELGKLTTCPDTCRVGTHPLR